MLDVYHSRTGAPWEIGARHDPVRWGDESGPLRAEQLARYDRDGFVILPDLFHAAEVDGFLAEAHRLAATVDRQTDDAVATEPDSDAIRSIFKVHERAPTLRALAMDHRIRGAARQILGSEVYIHQSRINFKPGFDGRAFPWHSDFETWHIEDGMPRMRALSASVLLTENTAVNGPLMLVPGSHRAFVRCVGETPRDHYKESLKNQRYGVPAPQALTRLVQTGGIVQALGGAGTVILFDCNAMHGSTGNLSPFPRHNVFLVYNSVENRLVAPFGDMPPRPEFLGARTPQATLAEAPRR
ncbi:MAG: ectoine hydroxylase [Myxococcales bacterium]|nr:ectoine hydroxylase [Myxococcales bacterium]